MSTHAKRPSRTLIAVALASLVAVSVAGTWVAAGRIRSPAEAAARTAAPEPSAILVPIERRVISSDIVTRGTGRFGSPQTLSLAASELKPSSGYVDTVPAVGTTLDEGEVAMVHSGRPLLMLQGDQPGYRDLGPGMSGPDVMQLEEALERLGHDPGPVDGTYDADTEAAVSKWYLDLGYAPFAANAAQIEAIAALEADLDAVARDTVADQDGVATARAELVTAQGVLRAATSTLTTAEATARATRAEAEAAVAAAEADAKTATVAAEQALILLPPEWSDAEEQQAALFELDQLRTVAAAARATVDQVSASGDVLMAAAANDVSAAPGEVASASAAVAAAQTRLNLAIEAAGLAAAPAARLEENLAVARQRAGIQVPSDEVVFLPDLPVRVAELLVARGSPADGPLLAVTDAVVAIDGSLALDQVSLVMPGMVVEVTEPDLGISAEAVVNFVADGPGTRGADGFHVYFEALITDSSTPIANIVGASVRLRLSVESSGGPVLAVPASAVTLAVDGSSQLLVDRAGAIDRVTVEPGLSASGYVAITAVDSADELVAGELVVIGYEAAGTSDG